MFDILFLYTRTFKVHNYRFYWGNYSEIYLGHNIYKLYKILLSTIDKEHIFIKYTRTYK